MDNTDIVTRARDYAIKAHSDTNHYYDNDKPYSVHLLSTWEFGVTYKHLLPPLVADNVLAACWLHDVIEDCRKTYNDIKKEFGQDVADIVYAVTNEKGRNRKERANERYYEGIRNTPFATYVKLCDRLANVSYSANPRTNIFYMYRKEHPDFLLSIYDERYKEMFDKLNELLR